MRTRRDQVQAYRFVTRRIVSALLAGDPETPNLPMRRLGLAVFGSVIAAAVVLGGVGAYGQLTGNAAPLESNTLVIERETGATYVFLDGRLHPTLNYASARLILGDAQPTVRTMSQASIADRPRGRAVGIVGAPDALPGPKALTGLPWSVCDVPDPANPRRSYTRVVIDRPLAGGTPLAERGMLVSVDDERYLLTRDTRLRVSGGDQALTALRMASAPTVRLSEQLLNAIPAGPVLRKPSISGQGDTTGTLVGDGPGRIGQVYRAAGEHYVLTRDGLVSISEISALLLLSDGGRVTDITPDQAGRLLVRQQVDAEGLPPTLPELHPARSGETVVCATYRQGVDGAPAGTRIEVFDRPPAELAPDAADVTQVRQGARDAVRTAESVLLPGGKGVLVQAGQGAGAAPGATVYLINEQGLRYPLGAGALTALGYEGVTPVVVPASLLALVPTGPVLDRDRALSFFEPSAAEPDPDAGSATPTTGG
ncbi:type VII secretion protein EccB [Micromonospora rosaria]|uniref:Type VII secretion protein EccB n=1 Tax=Micromonospora rosaria TaxID=47874 RepID=A0A136PK13_9ACTN|nr:type VII secretion protein EccB [Micromonospora rosaria]KXK58749.1 type VII secretion protein EccB [Micromonospora rosaria]